MKKKKKFRLATVLRVARLEEEAEQRRTAAAAREKHAAQVERDAREAAYAARDEVRPTETAAFRQQAMSNSLKAEALHVADANNLSAQDRLELAREDLMARARRTKTLEDLEERHNISFAITAALAAQRSLDDMVRYRRKH